jgi:hypothetical protein
MKSTLAYWDVLKPQISLSGGYDLNVSPKFHVLETWSSVQKC